MSQSQQPRSPSEHRAAGTPDGVEELTPADCAALFDAAAREALGISGQEFVSKWRAGAFTKDGDPRVTRVAMLMPEPWQPEGDT